MAANGVLIRRGHVVAVLIANAVLWIATVFVTHNPMIGGAGAVALISIATLLIQKQRMS